MFYFKCCKTEYFPFSVTDYLPLFEIHRPMCFILTCKYLILNPVHSYCLDVHFRSNKAVAVRDGAYSLFDTSKATEGFTPIPMLKVYCSILISVTLLKY